MTRRDDDDTKKKKKNPSIIEDLLSILHVGLKNCLDQAIDDVLKEFNKR